MDLPTRDCFIQGVRSMKPERYRLIMVVLTLLLVIVATLQLAS